MTNKIITAACCVIGDEILSGKTKDANSHYLAKTLFDLGIELKTVQVIGDDLHDISKSVRELSSNYDIVFTSGGIGPTHDDITYESIASAFNLEMKLDTQTIKYIEEQLKKRKTTSSNHHQRMATFPHPAQLLREKDDIQIPIVVVNSNIYILPGVPNLFKILLDSLVPRLEKLSCSTKFHRREIATQQSEVAIADILTAAQVKADQHNIKIGSYPVWGKNTDNIRVVISIVGKDSSQVDIITHQITEQVKGWPFTKSRL